MNPLIIKILRHQSIALIILFAGIVLFGCDKPLRFPFRVYPAPEKSADSLPAQAPIIIPKIVTDYDGNVYDGVQIGELIWMKQNLRVTHYADGTPIPNGMEMVPENANWAWYENHELVHNSDSTAYYYANPDADTSEYGLLYNWTAAVRGLRRIAYNEDIQGACPDGWHVPSDEEWTAMERYVSRYKGFYCGGDSTYIAKALAAKTGWKSRENHKESPDEQSYLLDWKRKKKEEEREKFSNEFFPHSDTNKNNATGFSALHAGLFVGGVSGFGEEANFWTSTISYDCYVWYRYINGGSPVVFRTYNTKDYGFSVRCVRPIKQ